MFKHILIVFFVSMVPLIELRGAIPYGVVYGLPLWLTFVVAIVGNMLPVPAIYFLARKVQARYRAVLLLLSAQGRGCRRKAESQGGPRTFLGAAAVRGDPSAGHRRMDGHAGGQSPEHGLQKKRTGLYGRRGAGGRHYGNAEPAGRVGVRNCGVK